MEDKKNGQDNIFESSSYLVEPLYTKNTHIRQNDNSFNLLKVHVSSFMSLSLL